MTKLHRIKASFAYARLPDEPLISRLTAVHDAMNGNPAYPHPPVELTVFKTSIDNLATATAAALDGGKKAIAERDRLRHEAILLAESLGHYVQANCNNDLSTFVSSGFTPVSYVRSASQPLAPPAVTKLVQGNTGELLVRIQAVASARSYELRYAPAGPDGVPRDWNTIPVGSVKSKITIEGLTPGTLYVVQARVLGSLGFSDWGQSANRMCI